MAYFCVGDRVHIRSDIRSCDPRGEYIRYYMDGDGAPMEDCGWNVVNEEMAEQAGRLVTITEVFPKAYSIAEDDYWWTDAMFEEYARAARREYDAPTESEIKSLLGATIQGGM